MENRNWLKVLYGIFPSSLLLENVLIFGLPLIIVLVLTTAFISCDNSEDCGLKSWQEEKWGTADGNEFCETQKDDSFLQQQQNTTSNLAFMYFSLVCFGFAMFDWKNRKNKNEPQSHLTYSPYLSVVYGVSLFYMGFGSFIFHAYTSSITFAHDKASILVQLVVVITFSILSYVSLENTYFRQLKASVLFLGAVAVTVVLSLSIVGTIDVDGLFTLTFISIPTIILLLVGQSIKQYRNNNSVFASIVLHCSGLLFFLIALFFQEQFIEVVCSPNSKFQFHAVWHVCAALGFFFTFLGLRVFQFKRKVTSKTEQEDVEVQLQVSV